MLAFLMTLIATAGLLSAGPPETEADVALATGPSSLPSSLTSFSYITTKWTSNCVWSV